MCERKKILLIQSNKPIINKTTCPSPLKYSLAFKVMQEKTLAYGFPIIQTQGGRIFEVFDHHYSLSLWLLK